jgi:hypothetical protein
MNKTATSLIDSKGRPNFGMHKQPIENLNIPDYRPLGYSAAKSKNPGFFERIRFKRWQFLGVSNPDIALAVAIVHAGFASKMFGYLYFKKIHDIHEFSIMSPLAKNTVFSGSSIEGETSFSSKEGVARMINSRQGYILEASVENNLAADINITRLKEPLCVVTRSGHRGFNYAHKEAGNFAEGKIHYKGTEWRLEQKNSFAFLDYTAGYLPRETYWAWSCGAGNDRGGRRIGFNFVNGINETAYTENCFWVDGALHKINTADIRFDDIDHFNPWNVFTPDKAVDLTFVPYGIHTEGENLGIIKNKLYQGFGLYEGKIKAPGKTHEIKEMFGFAEDNYILW